MTSCGTEDLHSQLLQNNRQTSHLPGPQAQVESGTEETQGSQEATNPERPLQPSTATVSPAVPSPSLQENGEHGQLTPLQQRIPSPPPGQSKYALRSQGPVADPADTNNPLEGYRYNTNRQRYVPKRQRDSSQERTCDNDKRPRIQCDVDCLSSGTTDPNVAPIQHSFEVAETARFDVGTAHLAIRCSQSAGHYVIVLCGNYVSRLWLIVFCLPQYSPIDPDVGQPSQCAVHPVQPSQPPPDWMHHRHVVLLHSRRHMSRRYSLVHDRHSVSLTWCEAPPFPGPAWYVDASDALPSAVSLPWHPPVPVCLVMMVLCAI